MRMNIVWFDDDLRPRNEGKTIERSRLQVWLRWFDSVKQDFNIIEVYTLSQFSELLQARSDLQQDPERQIHGFLIDQMWKASMETGDNFGKLHASFENERIRHLDAGVRLVSLMRNRGVNRPVWMRPYETTPTAIFTSITEFNRALDAYLDEEARGTVRGILKMSPDEQGCIIGSNGKLDDGLVKWARELPAQFRAS